MIPTPQNQIPIACDPNALGQAQHDHYQQLHQTLFAAMQRIEEREDGYSLAFPAQMLSLVAEYVALERLCCPFLRFSIQVEPGRDALQLTLSGQPGVKEFLYNNLICDLQASH